VLAMINCAFSSFILVSLLSGCGHMPTEQRSLTFEQCESLRAVIEGREKLGISAASDQAEDKRTLQRCLFFRIRKC